MTTRSVGLLLSCVTACVLAAAPTPTAAADEECRSCLRQRCDQLVAYYDYYAVSRGENSDGPRNHTRIRAMLECQCGDYRRGIDRMLVLMRNKAMVPPPPGGSMPEPEDE